MKAEELRENAIHDVKDTVRKRVYCSMELNNPLNFP
jgi:hypothetical protein